MMRVSIPTRLASQRPFSTIPNAKEDNNSMPPIKLKLQIFSECFPIEANQPAVRRKNKRGIVSVTTKPGARHCNKQSQPANMVMLH